MKPLSEDVVNLDQAEAETLPDLGDKPVGLARFFSKNAPWLKSRRRVNADPVSPAAAKPAESAKPK